MSWLGTFLFFGMFGGVILIWRGFYWFDRAYEARARGLLATAQRTMAKTYDLAGQLYCIQGVVLVAAGGTYFRLGCM